jgi:bifunctional UDP-N-acetylglucosamine pyrophosphorylase / glucosamine-1-phosphate N-acetyltransferase
MNEEDKIKIIILAAGNGKRMQSELPKVLVPLHNKPLIFHILDSIKKTGLQNKPVIVVGQKRALVMKAVGDDYTYVIQEEQLGTGHAVLATKKILENKASHIVVLYGDHPFISPKTIKNLITKHLKNKAKITMATVKLDDFDDWRNVFYTNFSRIIRNENNEIIKDIQFKDANEQEKKVTEVNPCYFCFEANWLWEKLQTLNTDNAQKEYYLTDLVRIAMKEKAKMESIQIEPHEALGVNSKNELEVLEKLVVE